MTDFNETGPQRSMEPIPDGTVVPVELTVRPGNAGDGGESPQGSRGMAGVVVAGHDPDFIDFALRTVDFAQNGRVPFFEFGRDIDQLAVIGFIPGVFSNEANVEKVRSGPETAKISVIDMI